MIVTQKYIAELLGTTRATVCRSLCNDQKISLRTRKSVNELANKLGYKPNLIARGLKGGNTNTVGVIWPLVGASRTTDAVHLLALNFQKRGHLTSIVDSFDLSVVDYTGSRLLYDRLPLSMCATLDDFRLRGIDSVVVDWRYGSISMPDQLKDRLSRFSQAVVVTMVEQDLDVNQVIHDRKKAYQQIAEYFAKTGRKRLAMLNANCPEENSVNIDGFVDTIRTFGLNLPFKGILGQGNGFFGTGLSITEKTCMELDKEFAQSKWPFDAVFCVNDESAMALINWLSKRGIKVPEDVAVVGFNNIDVATVFNPPLASVKRNDHKVAEEVADCIFRCAGSDRASNRPLCKTVEMEFVCRDSAGRQDHS